jgi:hypothetical protein
MVELLNRQSNPEAYHKNRREKDNGYLITEFLNYLKLHLYPNKNLPLKDIKLNLPIEICKPKKFIMPLSDLEKELVLMLLMESETILPHC